MTKVSQRGISWRLWGPPGVTSAVLIVALSGCGDSEAVVNPGGTLPPILSTTTIPASETTVEPFVESHKLTAGETLRSVAQEYNVPLAELVAFNTERLGGNLNNVAIGTEILIPPHRWIENLPATATTVGDG